METSINHRNHERLPFHSQFAVQNGHRDIGRGIDLSTSGMGFFTKERLEVGTRVNLIFQNDIFLVEGIVRHCTQDASESEYRNGVRFTTEARFIMPVLMMLEGA